MDAVAAISLMLLMTVAVLWAAFVYDDVRYLRRQSEVARLKLDKIREELDKINKG